MFLTMLGVGETWGATIVYKVKGSGDTSNSYVNTETEQTSGSYKYKINHWNPSNGQVRGNQSTASENFYLYNTDELPGYITKIEIFNGSGTFDKSKIYYVLGTSACTSSSSGTAFSSSWTASVTGSNTYFRVYFTNGATSSSCYFDSIRVTYTNPDPYTVTFNKQGGTFDDDSEFTRTSPSYQIDEASGGAGITLPHASPSSACTSEGWGFYGWATTAVGSSTTTAPTIVGKAGDTYHPLANTTLHAVFAQGEYTNIHYK